MINDFYQAESDKPTAHEAPVAVQKSAPKPKPVSQKNQKTLYKKT